jgi:GH24 family phage-related lysozyme (muramidase)
MAATLKDPSNLYGSIKKHESFRSNPYWDVNGYAIGYGTHTNPLTGQKVQPGDYIERSQADSLLASSVQPYADTVQRQLGADSWNSLTANQQNALTDYAYNYGSLTSDVKAAVQKYQQTGDASVVSDAMLARGQKDNGGSLMGRRQDEADAFANDKPMSGNAKAGSAGAGAANNGAASGAGGGGGGAGCMGGAMGALGMMAMGGMLGGLGLGGIMSGIGGQISGALGGALGNISGALGGALGNLGSIASSVTGALGGVTGALQGAMGGITSALGNLPGMGQLGSIANSLTGGIGGALGGALGSVGNFANSLAGNVLGQISGIGSNIIPGLGNVISGTLQGGLNQLISPLTAVIQNPLNIVGVAQQFSAQGGLAGFVKNVANNMAGNFVGGTMQNLINNVGMASGFSGISRQIVGGVSEALGQEFGSGLGGLGSLVRNIDGLATFGVSTLGDNLAAVAMGMINTGQWDARNLTRLMQPGNIAAQIVSRGLGESTGLLQGLISRGVPLAGMDNPIYDKDIQQVLSSINASAALTDVSKAFGVNVSLSNLGQLTDLNYMMSGIADKLPIKNFQDLGLTLTSMQITGADTFKDIGDAFLRIETTKDLNNISTMPTPMHRPTAESMIKNFGYGSGTFGETTMADMMGTMAGYVHEDTFPVIVDNVNWLYLQSEAAKYFRGVNLLECLITGQYTSTNDNTTGTITYTYTVPSGDAKYLFGLAAGSVYTTTDTSVYPPAHPENLSESSGAGLAAAVAAVIDYIEDGMLLLKNSTNPDIQAAITAIDTAHNASIAQILREATLLKIHGVNIFQTATMTPISAYAFAMSLPEFAKMTGHGQMADFITRLCQDNIYGDAIKACMRQARNAEILQPLGVNVERFNLPNSQYYRDPLGMVNDFYNGMTPAVPRNTSNIYYPTDPKDRYVMNRDSMLADNGATDRYMSNAERDEMYYDMMWSDKDTNSKEQIGQNAVRAALERNLKLLGNNLEIVDLDKSRYVIGKVTSNGIEDLDANTFITIMFDIVNRILYGNIGTTKNENPFYTEQMIYAVAEALGDANASTVLALLETYLGRNVMLSILTRLANRFRVMGTVADTTMDRNDPDTYGGVGPGIDPIDSI